MGGKKNNFVAVEPVLEREPVQAGTDRSFGFVFAAVFALIGARPLLDGRPPHVWALAVACAFLAAAAFTPWILRPMNALWMRFGALLHGIVTPILMGVVFFLAIMPTALIVRSLRKDPLRLRRDKSADSYWIERQPGPDPHTMTRQY